ncbi:MAG: hypothetical protein J6M18_00540 [Actinomycetaceae bacterium]|nr:hypothetical protein [Actinomycetaceae bacterium]
MKKILSIFMILSCVLWLSSCAHDEVKSEDKTNLPPSQMDRKWRYDHLLGDNGLLFMPDIWGTLPESIEAEIMYKVFQGDNEKTAWNHSFADTYGELVESTGEYAAYYVIKEFQLFSDEVIKSNLKNIEDLWNKVSGEEEPIISMYLLNELSRDIAIPLHVNDEHVSIVGNSRESDDCLEKRLASYLYAQWNNQEEKGNFNYSTCSFSLLEHIPYVMRLDERESKDIDKNLRNAVMSQELANDLVKARLYKVFHAYSDEEGKKILKEQFNKHQLLETGRVLGSPIFNGTVETTFNLLQFEKKYGQEIIDSRIKEELVIRLRAADIQNNEETRLPALAALSLLGEKIDTSDVKDAYSSLLNVLELSGEIFDEPFSSASAAATYVKIYPYIHYLDINSPFPGLSNEALEEWEKGGGEAVFISAKMLLLIHEADPEQKNFLNERKMLFRLLDTVLDTYTIDEIPSSVLFSVYAAYKVENRQKDKDKIAAIEAEKDRRKHTCVGGYDFLYAELPTESPCSFEGTFSLLYVE